jgi:hypothetical protein
MTVGNLALIDLKKKRTDSLASLRLLPNRSAPGGAESNLRASSMIFCMPYTYSSIERAMLIAEATYVYSRWFGARGYNQPELAGRDRIAKSTRLAIFHQDGWPVQDLGSEYGNVRTRVKNQGKRVV